MFVSHVARSVFIYLLDGSVPDAKHGILWLMYWTHGEEEREASKIPQEVCYVSIRSPWRR